MGNNSTKDVKEPIDQDTFNKSYNYINFPDIELEVPPTSTVTLDIYSVGLGEYFHRFEETNVTLSIISWVTLMRNTDKIQQCLKKYNAVDDNELIRCIFEVNDPQIIELYFDIFPQYLMFLIKDSTQVDKLYEKVGDKVFDTVDLRLLPIESNTTYYRWLPAHFAAVYLDNTIAFLNFCKIGYNDEEYYLRTSDSTYTARQNIISFAKRVGNKEISYLLSHPQPNDDKYPWFGTPQEIDNYLGSLSQENRDKLICSTNSTTAIHLICHKDTVDVLYRWGAHLNIVYNGTTAIEYTPFLDVFKQLLKYYLVYEPGSLNYNLLFIDSADSVTNFQRQGAQINCRIKTPSKNFPVVTPLQMVERKDIAMALFRAGANLDGIRGTSDVLYPGGFNKLRDLYREYTQSLYQPRVHNPTAPVLKAIPFSQNNYEESVVVGRIIEPLAPELK